MKNIKCRKCKKLIPQKDPEQRVGFCDKCHAEIFGRDSVEFDRLQREIAKRQRFIDKVDERDTDPVQTQKQADAEYKKYCRYETEIKELSAKQSKLDVKGFE